MAAFTYYRQFEEMDCGAACLRMVARAYGREFGLEELRERTRISRSGVSLLGISEGAESIGLQTLALPISIDQLKQDIPLPCILPWQSAHFVVLYACDKDGFHVADPDPAVQVTVLSEIELLNGWLPGGEGREHAQGNALILEPTDAFYQGNKEQRFDGGGSYLRGYLRTYRKLLAGVGVGMLLVLAAQVAFPFLLRSLVDTGIVLDDTSFILLVVVAQGVLLIVSTLLAAIRNYSLTYVGGRINLSMTGDYLAKVLRLPLAFFDSRSTGDILQRVRDHDRLEETLVGDASYGAVEIVRLCAFAVVLLLWNPVILTIFVLGTGLTLFSLNHQQRRRRELDRLKHAQRVAEGESLLELVQGAAELKQFGAGLDKRWAWERLRAERYRSDLEVQSLDHRQRTVSGLLFQITALASSCVAALAVTTGSLSLGGLVAIQYILAQLGSPVDTWWQWLSAYREGRDALERIAEVHGKRDELQDRPEKSSSLDAQQEIRLIDIGFHYDRPSAPLVLQGLNAVMEAGKITAIVGESGSGKSTLLKLLFGHYQPTSGSVHLGGIDYGKINRAAWRRQVALVGQESYLFTDTVLGNITMGDTKVDKERLDKALSISQLKPVTDQLLEGMATVVGPRGTGLSRGQVQRLLLARAIYRKPRYLLLDEATSGLDAFMEVTIMDNLFEYLKGSTIIMVAHRYATFQQADQILVLEQGSIAERGSHLDLMAERKQYYRIVNHQMLIGN